MCWCLQVWKRQNLHIHWRSGSVRQSLQICGSLWQELCGAISWPWNLWAAASHLCTGRLRLQNHEAASQGHLHSHIRSVRVCGFTVVYHQISKSHQHHHYIYSHIGSVIDIVNVLCSCQQKLHACKKLHAHIKDPVVCVRVWWVMDTPN